MPHPLRRRLVVEGDLVARRRLRRQADAAILQEVVVDALLAVEVEAVGDRLIDAPVPAGHEEPEPVAHDRSAQRDVVVEDALDVRHRFQTARAQLVAEVVALQAAGRVAGERRAPERVPAVLGHHADADAARERLRGDGARLVAHLLVREIVVIDRRIAAVTVHGCGSESVDLHRHVARLGAVDREIRDLVALRSADIRPGNRHARCRDGDGLKVPRGGQRVEQFARQHVLRLRALDVHERRRPRDGDRLLNRADFHFRVHRRGEIRRQLDAGLLDRREAGERERHVIRTGPQVHDFVLPLRVGHDRSHALDQRRACRLDGHPGKHRACRVLYCTGDGALRASCRRNERYEGDQSDTNESSATETLACLFHRCTSGKASDVSTGRGNRQQLISEKGERLRERAEPARFDLNQYVGSAFRRTVGCETRRRGDDRNEDLSARCRPIAAVSVGRRAVVRGNVRTSRARVQPRTWA